MKERKHCLKCGKVGNFETYSGGATGIYHNDCHGAVVYESLFELWLTKDEMITLETIKKFVLKIELK